MSDRHADLSEPLGSWEAADDDGPDPWPGHSRFCSTRRIGLEAACNCSGKGIYDIHQIAPRTDVYSVDLPTAPAPVQTIPFGIASELMTKLMDKLPPGYHITGFPLVELDLDNDINLTKVRVEASVERDETYRDLPQLGPLRSSPPRLHRWRFGRRR